MHNRDGIEIKKFSHRIDSATLKEPAYTQDQTSP